MDNNEFDYKRLGARLAGGASGLGTSEYMFRNTARGASLGKHKLLRPFVGAYSVLQGQYLGNKAYNINKQQIQKQASWEDPRSPNSGPVYGNDPKINYESHPSRIANAITSGLTTVGGTALGAGMGHLAKATFRANGFRRPGLNMITGAMPLAGTYLGFKASRDNGQEQNAYTAMPNV